MIIIHAISQGLLCVIAHFLNIAGQKQFDTLLNSKCEFYFLNGVTQLNAPGKIMLVCFK